MKRTSPSAERNKEPIAQILSSVLPATGVVLEIASGSGQHVVHFASRFSHLEWQPTDPDEASLESIRAWIGESQLPNLRSPVKLDVTEQEWPMRGPLAAIVCINMIHIAPWRATVCLFEGASTRLGIDAPVVLYGPYHEGGSATAPSNAQFDERLRTENPEWGVRNIEDVVSTAAHASFRLIERISMPANNLTLVFRKSDST